MKRHYFVFLLSFIPFFAFAQSTVNGSFDHDGITRTYFSYIPASYSPAQSAPLILNLHGYTSNNIQQQLYSGFGPIADTAGFIMVFPQGTNELLTQQPFWNFGIFGETVDDLGFLEALIDTISAHYNIDQKRIYSTGMSNGASMSIFMACRSNRFAAVASVCGSMSVQNPCTPSYPIPVMEIFGTSDPIGPYEGNATSQPIENVVSFWVLKNQCNPTPQITAVPDINTGDGCTAEHYLYSGGIDGHTVEFYKINNGGHTWPGVIPIPMYGNTCMDFNASKEIWRFFRQFSRENAVGLANVVTDTGIAVMPNPSQDQLYIQFGESVKNGSYELLNINGRLLRRGRLTQSNHVIDTSDLNVGTYFIRIEIDNYIITRKVIILK